jgi:hypothetical protein
VKHWQFAWITSPYYCLQRTGHNKVGLRCVDWRTHSAYLWHSMAFLGCPLPPSSRCCKWPLSNWFRHQDSVHIFVSTLDVHFHLSVLLDCVTSARSAEILMSGSSWRLESSILHTYFSLYHALFFSFITFSFISPPYRHSFLPPFSLSFRFTQFPQTRPFIALSFVPLSPSLPYPVVQFSKLLVIIIIVFGFGSRRDL